MVSYTLEPITQTHAGRNKKEVWSV